MNWELTICQLLGQMSYIYDMILIITPMFSKYYDREIGVQRLKNLAKITEVMHDRARV